jgi:uncharacterized iron-regulated protein
MTQRHTCRLALAAILVLSVSHGAAPVLGQDSPSGAPSSLPAPSLETPPPWAAPELTRSVVVADGRTGETLSWSALLEQLAAADAVFLGEQHTDETTHSVELAMYEGLLAARPGEVVLAMEMFERDVQHVLDAYIAGQIDEAAFLEQSHPWGSYHTAYRPLVERARATGGRVVASNFPRSLRRRMSMEGREVLDQLEGDESAHAPAELFPNTEAYWRRVDNAVRGHLAMMRADNQDDPQRQYSTQTLWDNSMGDACAQALDESPGALVLHVNGGFHSSYWDGTVRQLLLRKPDAKVLTVSIVPCANPSVADVSGEPVADYIVFAEQRAQDENSGTHKVFVTREIKYRLRLPAPVGELDTPVPLLIWLSDDGFTDKDGLALWRSRLGYEVALAVLQAPYRETQTDLAEGGRWFWPDSFPEDIDALESAVEKTWAYLLRHYPLDPTRVCLAGEGTGATVAAAIVLRTGSMDIRAVGLSPRRYVKIKDFPLPLPEFRGDDHAPSKSLSMWVTPDDEDWWRGEIDEYLAIGFESALHTVTEDAWQRELEQENVIRGALGLEPRTLVAEAERRHIVVEDGSPRALHWARLLGIRHTDEHGEPVAVLTQAPASDASHPISIDTAPARFEDGSQLPRCPGPFGGTTVLVLPDDAPATDIDAWLAIESADPIHAASRFHRLRIAHGGRPLAELLDELLEAGRKNVLIIPTRFCADGSEMRRLQASTRAHDDRMTLRWQPGLGAPADEH